MGLEAAGEQAPGAVKDCFRRSGRAADGVAPPALPPRPPRTSPRALTHSLTAAAAKRTSETLRARGARVCAAFVSATRYHRSAGSLSQPNRPMAAAAAAPEPEELMPRYAEDSDRYPGNYLPLNPGEAAVMSAGWSGAPGPNARPQAPLRRPCAASGVERCAHYSLSFMDTALVRPRAGPEVQILKTVLLVTHGPQTSRESRKSMISRRSTWWTTSWTRRNAREPGSFDATQARDEAAC